MWWYYQAGAKEGKLPDVDEGDGGAGVDAEDADAGEGGDHTREEGEEVREGGHLDGWKGWWDKEQKRAMMECECMDEHADEDKWMNEDKEDHRDWNCCIRVGQTHPEGLRIELNRNNGIISIIS